MSRPRWLTSKTARREIGDETKLVRAAIELLHRHGYPAWRNSVGLARHAAKDGREYMVAYGVVGMPDVAAFVPGSGRGIWIECKVGKRKLTYEQRRFMEDMQAAGCLVYELRDDADGLIDAIRDGVQGKLGPCYPKRERRPRGRGRREGTLFRQAVGAGGSNACG